MIFGSATVSVDAVGLAAGSADFECFLFCATAVVKNVTIKQAVSKEFTAFVVRLIIGVQIWSEAVFGSGKIWEIAGSKVCEEPK